MRRSLTIAASILAGCLMIGLLLSRVTVSQVAPAAPPATGRYQVAIAAGSTSDATKAIVVCDTASGQCWTYIPGQDWRDLGIPGEVAKARAAK